MLPSQHPALSAVDYEYDAGQQSEDEEDLPTIQLSSIEINMLIYQYLSESQFQHSAYTFLNESKLPDTDMYKHFNPREPTHKTNWRSNGNKHSPAVSSFGEVNGRLDPGLLIKKLWKAVRWEEVERHIGSDGLPYKDRCPKPFYLIRPHTCPPTLASAVDNPTTKFPVLNMIQPTSPAEPPSDVEEEIPQAGPSKRKAQPTVATAKRRSRRNSGASTAITRSPSPNGRKKRSQTDDEDDFTDTPDKAKLASGGKGGRRKGTLGEYEGGLPKDKLIIPPASTPGRSASPTKQDQSDLLSSAIRLGEGNPKWFKASEIGLFPQHNDIVNAVSWSPTNHELLASAANDTTARIWDFKKSSETGSKKLELVPGENPVAMRHQTVNKRNPVICLSWNPAGTLLVTGTKEGLTRTYLAHGIETGDFSTQGTNLPINAIKFSPNGRLIMMASSAHTVQIVDASLRPKGTIKSHSKAVNDVDWLDDFVFASGGNDHRIFVHRIEDQRYHYVFEGHEEEVQLVRWSPSHLHTLPSSNQRYLASIADDGYLIIWQMPTYPVARHKSSSAGGSASPLKREDRDSTIGDVGDDYQFEAAAKYLVCRWLVVDVTDKRLLALDWCRDKIEGRMLLAAGGPDCTIKIYDLFTQQLVHALEGFEEGTGCLAFSPEGFRGSHGAIAGGSWNASFKVWDVETGEVLKEFRLEEDESQQGKRARPFVTSIAWKPDGEHIAIGLYNKAIMTFYVGDLKLPSSSSSTSKSPLGKPIIPAASEDKKEMVKDGDGDGDVLMK